MAVAADGTVTVISDSARELLGLPADGAGRKVADLGLEPRVRDALGARRRTRRRCWWSRAGWSSSTATGCFHEGRQVGTVTTLRDRTELLAMQSELNARESITETLRAQTHEFNNQLHTISGLIQLEEYAEAPG